MEGFAVIPPMSGGEGFIELSRSRSGRVFEKHILNFGPLLYPGIKGGKVDIDEKFAKTLVKNFKNKVCDIVQVPIAGANNEHTEDPTRNIGEVIGLSVRDNKIYAQIDARDEVSAASLGKTLLGASAMLHLDYTDTRTRTKVGPTLLHVLITNRPYIPGLDDYSELIAASADCMGDAVVLTAPPTRETKMLDDLIAELKADHGIDVVALQAQASSIDGAVALSSAVQDALTETGLLRLSNADAAPTTEDLVSSIEAAGEQIVSLSAEVEDMRTKKARAEAEQHVDGLIRTGHLLPKTKEANVTLLLSNPELFDALLPENPVIRLSHEAGAESVDHTPTGLAQSEVDRIAAAAKESGYSTK